MSSRNLLAAKLFHHKFEVLRFGQLGDVVLVDKLFLVGFHRRV